MTRFDKFIPPGSEGKVYASVDISHIKGAVQKSIDVMTNDANRPNVTLVIKASVKTLVDFAPEEQVRFNVTKGTLGTQELIVSADPSVKLMSPVTDSDMIAVKMADDDGIHPRWVVSSSSKVCHPMSGCRLTAISVSRVNQHETPADV